MYRKRGNMLDTIFETDLDQTINLSLDTMLLSVIAALILGLIISFIYIYSDKEKKYSTSFAISLVILPAVVAVVIMLVGSNIARAFSMGGAFALVRFRSIPGDSKDISTVFYAMAVGLAAGLGFVGYAAIITLIIGAVYFVLVRAGYGKRRNGYKTLKIMVPENMSFSGAFDDLFEKYADDVKLIKVRTTNMGSLFELTYDISVKKDTDEKEFIDELRCRNGNLNILLGIDELTKELL